MHPAYSVILFTTTSGAGYGLLALLGLTAATEARAMRRHKELLERGCASIYAHVLQDMRERDARDSRRSIAPLTPAPDSLVIDTSALDADAAFAIAVAHIGALCQDSAKP